MWIRRKAIERRGLHGKKSGEHRYKSHTAIAIPNSKGDATTYLLDAQMLLDTCKRDEEAENGT